MRTNIVLDDELMEVAFLYSGLKTKKEVIHQALLEFVENRKKKDLRDLKGKIQIKKGYDYKSLRAGK
ncbi:MAG TPA: type II toxin-antitoxin system VapB family antitoxin [Leptospiraceae bacterium]|nr:type II toxin-antitoxin system VapB family antitoxin [Leptospiraceae bacterium]HMW07341.1 type II toxin-antitoxin system VapB family antitoxin [Leptospiraceae bacterium]HMX33385.1 type II toxin-antitoxin system VapB family antitoxin [Leptospiraceae bacterium]HMY32951.1 type II toxin-antitoxin system VapB family antitoxin [Leptospiraceae bacterium]HMZ64565.1 type II toxin-antitoxin system VapB family antitoxin [Leptospiraceae bacterium]